MLKLLGTFLRRSALLIGAACLVMAVVAWPLSYGKTTAHVIFAKRTVLAARSMNGAIVIRFMQLEDPVAMPGGGMVQSVFCRENMLAVNLHSGICLLSTISHADNGRFRAQDIFGLGYAYDHFDTARAMAPMAPQEPAARTTLDLHMPYWFIALVCIILMLPGTLALKGRRKNPDTSAVHCLGCGYDVRASKERCPECGRAIPPAT